MIKRHDDLSKEAQNNSKVIIKALHGVYNLDTTGIARWFANGCRETRLQWPEGRLFVNDTSDTGHHGLTSMTYKMSLVLCASIQVSISISLLAIVYWSLWTKPHRENGYSNTRVYTVPTDLLKAWYNIGRYGHYFCTRIWCRRRLEPPSWSQRKA